MPSSSAQHEPTMEEILASIRKIISEDANEAQHSAPAVPEPEVLELTQEVREESALAPAAAEPSAVEREFAAPEPVKAEPVQNEEPVPPAASATENVVPLSSNEEHPVSSPAQLLQHDGIFSEKSRKAIDDAFAGLEQMNNAPKAEAAKPAPLPSVQGNSIEAVFERAVRASVDPVLAQWKSNHQGDLMSSVKPLLRDWMDDHFPALLEGAVREEVARVVKARGGR
jgi:cell pole-organizing protein PopZ